MGACGCSMNDTRYTLPGPGNSFYVISLSGKCNDCDAPPGVTIELIKPEDSLYAEYHQGVFIDGPLKLEKWPDSEGAAIVTGMRKSEFVKAVQAHLIGVSLAHFSKNGMVDRIGAETILEEMYDDSQARPHVVEPVKR